MYVEIYSVTLFKRKIIHSCNMYLELLPPFIDGTAQYLHEIFFNETFLNSIHYLSIHSNTGVSFLCIEVVKLPDHFFIESFFILI